MIGDVKVVSDGDCLYRAVHVQHMRDDGSIRPIAFCTGGPCEGTNEEFVSVDWSRFSSPLECRNRRRAPEKNHVFSLRVHDVRALNIVRSVEHRPSGCNYAHAGVFATEERFYRNELRLELLRIATRVDLELCSARAIE